MRQLDQIRRELEQEAEDTYARLTEVERSLAASEETRRKQNREFEQRLMEVRARAKEQPPEQLRLYLERSRKAAKLHKFRTSEADYAWPAQLRLPGPRKCCGERTLLAQASDWGWVTACCLKCRKTRTLKWEEFCGLDVWVSCPRCCRRMEPKAIGRYGYYGYACANCNVTCLLANLLPEVSDIIAPLERARELSGD